MLSRIRNSLFTRVLWGLMGLFLLNISVDSADQNPESIPEDLSINDQESIVEIVVEQILGYEDAFEEYDDHDTEGHQKKSNFKLECFSSKKMDLASNDFIQLEPKPKFLEFTHNLTTGFIQLHAPPPEV